MHQPTRSTIVDQNVDTVVDHRVDEWCWHYDDHSINKMLIFLMKNIKCFMTRCAHHHASTHTLTIVDQHVDHNVDHQVDE